MSTNQPPVSLEQLARIYGATAPSERDDVPFTDDDLASWRGPSYEDEDNLPPLPRPLCSRCEATGFVGGTLPEDPTVHALCLCPVCKGEGCLPRK